MHVCADWEGRVAVAAEDIEGGASQEVAVRVEVDFGCALSFVGDGTIKVFRIGCESGVDGDVEFEVDGKGETNDVEAWAYMVLAVVLCRDAKL